MKPAKPDQLHDGEWTEPVLRGYIMECCGCGLRHRVDFRLKDVQIQFKATRVKQEAKP